MEIVHIEVSIENSHSTNGKYTLQYQWILHIHMNGKLCKQHTRCHASSGNSLKILPIWQWKKGRKDPQFE